MQLWERGYFRKHKDNPTPSLCFYNISYNRRYLLTSIMLTFVYLSVFIQAPMTPYTTHWPAQTTALAVVPGDCVIKDTFGGRMFTEWYRTRDTTGLEVVKNDDKFRSSGHRFAHLRCCPGRVTSPPRFGKFSVLYSPENHLVHIRSGETFTTVPSFRGRRWRCRNICPCFKCNMIN